jgi:hypothetical protein
MEFLEVLHELVWQYDPKTFLGKLQHLLADELEVFLARLVGSAL